MHDAIPKGFQTESYSFVVLQLLSKCKWDKPHQLVSHSITSSGSIYMDQGGNKTSKIAQVNAYQAFWDTKTGG